MQKYVTIDFNGKKFPVDYQIIKSGNNSADGNEKVEFFVTFNQNSELTKYCSDFRVVYHINKQSITITGPTQETFQGKQIQDDIITAIKISEGLVFPASVN